jgi:ubiquinone/menaquinone biosynthesis C-methylase UbiE
MIKTKKNISYNEYLEIEKVFHDNCADSFDWEKLISGNYSYDYDDAEEIIQYFEKLLGNVNNKKILDIGSGYGNCALTLSQKNAHVTSIDISKKLVKGCMKRAKSNNLKVDFKVMNACELSFNDNSFDNIVAFRTIHHLPDIKEFFLEAYRVLKKNGSLIIVEPQKYNPFVEFGRKFIRNKGTDRTITEHPLVPRNIRDLRQIFGEIEKKEFWFLSVGCLFFKDIINIQFLYKLSRIIFKRVDQILRYIPFLRPFYWQVVIKAEKK